MKTSNPLLERLKHRVSGAIARGEAEAIVGIPATYKKLRFTSKAHGSTAGLVIETRKLGAMTISEMSRLFPYSEANKMRNLEASPEFASWDEAFAYTFPRS